MNRVVDETETGCNNASKEETQGYDESEICLVAIVPNDWQEYYSGDLHGNDYLCPCIVRGLLIFEDSTLLKAHHPELNVHGEQNIH